MFEENINIVQFDQNWRYYKWSVTRAIPKNQQNKHIQEQIKTDQLEGIGALRGVY